MYFFDRMSLGLTNYNDRFYSFGDMDDIDGYKNNVSTEEYKYKRKEEDPVNNNNIYQITQIVKFTEMDE